MNDIPTWWLYLWLILSGVFFLLNIVFFGAMAFALFKLASVVSALAPKVTEMSAKVDSLIHKVEAVATRLEELATSVKDNVDNVGAKASGVIGSVELIAQSVSKQFERFSPFLVGAMTAMRLIKSLNEMKKGRSAIEATKGKTLEKKRATPAGKRAPQPAKKRFGLF